VWSSSTKNEREIPHRFSLKRREKKEPVKIGPIRGKREKGTISAQAIEKKKQNVIINFLKSQPSLVSKGLCRAPTAIMSRKKIRGEKGGLGVVPGAALFF